MGRPGDMPVQDQCARPDAPWSSSRSYSAFTDANDTRRSGATHAFVADPSASASSTEAQGIDSVGKRRNFPALGKAMRSYSGGGGIGGVGGRKPCAAGSSSTSLQKDEAQREIPSTHVFDGHDSTADLPSTRRTSSSASPRKPRRSSRILSSLVASIGRGATSSDKYSYAPTPQERFDVNDSYSSDRPSTMTTADSTELDEKRDVQEATHTSPIQGELLTHHPTPSAPETRPGSVSSAQSNVDRSVTAAPRPPLSILPTSRRWSRSLLLSPLGNSGVDPPATAGDGATPVGSFNLRSFRNIRPDHSYISGEHRQRSDSVLSTSQSFYSAGGEATSPQEEFGAATGLATPTSMNERTFSNSFAAPDSPHSKMASPHLETHRMPSGSISVGMFRRGAARSRQELGSVFYDDNAASSITSKPGSPLQDESVPNFASPRNGVSNNAMIQCSTGARSPGEELAALEAGLARMRAMPLLHKFPPDDHEEKKKEDTEGSVSQDTPSVPSKDSVYSPMLPGAVPTTFGQRDADEETFDLERPRLPWLNGHAQPRAEQYGERMQTQAPVALEVDYGKPRQDVPLAIAGLGPLHPQSSTDAAHECAAPESTADAIDVSSRRARKHEADSAPRKPSSKTPDFGQQAQRQRCISSGSLSTKEKMDRMKAFHEQHAPSLSDAHRRSEIQSTQTARIAWPTPPCVDAAYYSHLSAMHQHSLYEQHRKAADFALGEYMRLMAGVVPPEAMVQPMNLFSPAKDDIRPFSAQRSSSVHARSKSTSSSAVPGGDFAPNRRRSIGSLALGATGSRAAIPPLPLSQIPPLLTFVTKNSNKLREVRSILTPGGDQLRLFLTHSDLDLPEIQGNVQEVALAKCRSAVQKINGPCLTEDTALVFMAFGELPGPYIKWFASSIGLAGLVRMLYSFSADHSGRAICTLGYATGPRSEPILFDGSIEGTIVPPRGSSAFGWDAIFQPKGHYRTFGEMSADEKAAVSHRARALTKLRAHLRENPVRFESNVAQSQSSLRTGSADARDGGDDTRQRSPTKRTGSLDKAKRDSHRSTSSTNLGPAKSDNNVANTSGSGSLHRHRRISSAIVDVARGSLRRGQRGEGGAESEGASSSSPATSSHEEGRPSRRRSAASVGR